MSEIVKYLRLHNMSTDRHRRYIPMQTSCSSQTVEKDSGTGVLLGNRKGMFPFSIQAEKSTIYFSKFKIMSDRTVPPIGNR